MIAVSKNNALSHYQWGNDCKAWTLAELPGLSVKQEMMPPHTSEALHFHRQANQFFFIISGQAVFEIDEHLVRVNEQEGILIEAGKKHRVKNESNQTLAFLLASQPSTQNDRIVCD